MGEEQSKERKEHPFLDGVHRFQMGVSQDLVLEYSGTVDQSFQSVYHQVFHSLSTNRREWTPRYFRFLGFLDHQEFGMVDGAKVICYILKYAYCCLLNPHLLNREKRWLHANHAWSQINRLSHHHDLQEVAETLPRLQQEVWLRTDHQLHPDRCQQAIVAEYRLTSSHHSPRYFLVLHHLLVLRSWLVVHLRLLGDRDWNVHKL